jgi:hypothetical protein
MTSDKNVMTFFCFAQASRAPTVRIRLAPINVTTIVCSRPEQHTQDKSYDFDG